MSVTLDTPAFTGINVDEPTSGLGGEKVLVELAVVICPHAGILSLTGETISDVDSSGIVTTNSVTSDTVTACAWINPITTVPSPCTTVKSTSGASTVFKVNGYFVLLKTSTIIVNNPDTTTYPTGVICGVMSAGQIKLEA